MAHRTMPILYLNLCGEMLYIIDQRLIDTKADPEKQIKVCNDILQVAFNRKFINEIFTHHQPIYSRKVLKAMFERLAHASTVRVTPESLDKMYELMVMAVKHQIQTLRNPRHLIMITLNHLDAMQDYTNNPELKRSIYLAYEHLINVYTVMSCGQLQSIRYAILNFLQDIKVLVSIFVSRDQQYPDGSFKYFPPDRFYKGVDKPGQIIYFDHKGEVMGTTSFNPGMAYGELEHDGGCGLHEIGNRGTQLGMNMYANCKTDESKENSTKGASKYTYSEIVENTAPVDTDPEIDEKLFPKVKKTDQTTSDPDLLSANSLIEPSGSSVLAKDELNLLAKLIGTDTIWVDKNEPHGNFRLNLLDLNESNDKSDKKTNSYKTTESEKVTKPEGTIEFDMKGTRRKRDNHLDQIMGELSIGTASNIGKKSPEDDEDDLLALMDRAN